MPIQHETTKVNGVGNGVATVFSFSPMTIWRSSDMTVTHVSAAGVETTLTEGSGASNYSVSVSEYPGTGSVVYPADQVTPMANDGQYIIMKPVLPYTQLTNLENQGGYDPDTQEDMHDKAAVRDLQLKEEIDRSMKSSISTGAAVDLTVPAPEADKFFAWASDGLSIVLKTLADLGAVIISDLTPLVASGSGAAGSSEEISRADHVHASEASNATPIVSSGAGAAGSSSGLSRADHVHPSDASTTQTFTNKTYDANGTGNVLSNVDIGNCIAASQAEAEAGTNNTKILTPLRVAQAIAKLGTVKQIVSSDIVDATGTTTIPDDTTVPLVSEGTEIASQAITPADAANKVLVQFSCTIQCDGSTSGADKGVIVSVFRGSTCIGAHRVANTVGAAYEAGWICNFSTLDSPASASEVTYSVRIGGVGTNWTWYVNRSVASATALNSVMEKNQIILSEVA